MGKTRYTRKPRITTVYPNGFKEHTLLGTREWGPGEETEYDWSCTTEENRGRKNNERLGVLHSRHPSRHGHTKLTREYNKTGTRTLRLRGGRRWEERDERSDRLKGIKKAQKGRMKARLKREEDIEINKVL